MMNSVSPTGKYETKLLISSVEAGDVAFLDFVTRLMNAAKGVRYPFQINKREEK